MSIMAEITFREYIDSAIESARQERLLMIESLRREVDLHLAAQESAVLKSERSYDKRFESVNEFRAQLADQQLTFAPREVVDQRLGAVERSHAKIVGGLILATFVGPLITAFLTYALTH